jgi:CheY-like chemotaxis protein
MKKRVLLVDDEAAFTNVVKINLEATDLFEVRIENQSHRVLDAAHEFEPHIILLDIVMPGLDGGDVKQQLQQSPQLKDTPVIFVTALVQADDTHPGSLVQSGEDVMIAKPVRTEQLIKAIEDKLAGRI